MRNLLIGIAKYSTLRKSQRALECAKFSSVEIPFSGINTAVMRSGPRASTASLSVSAESIPPDTPITAFSKPNCLKYLWIPPIIFV